MKLILASVSEPQM